MGRTRESHREAKTIWRARFIDAVSREQVGQATFSADSVEEARQRAWRIAASGFGTPAGAVRAAATAPGAQVPPGQGFRPDPEYDLE